MKKLPLIILLFIVVITTIKASAQSGLNNNSDWHVPVPQVQVPQTSAFNAPTIAATVLPSLPVAIPTVSFAPSVSTARIAPAPPEVPKPPAFASVVQRTTNIQAPTATVSTTGTTSVTISLVPTIPSLPPVSPLPPTPELRLSIR